jgi:antitoxin FitA
LTGRNHIACSPRWEGKEAGQPAVSRRPATYMNDLQERATRGSGCSSGRLTDQLFATPKQESRAKLDINALIDYNDCMRSEGPRMSSITIRNLDPAVKERLRVRAAQNGHSMEAEARRILQITLKAPDRPPARSLYERIRARFEPLGGADDLELPPRLPDRDPPRFD